MTVRLLSWSFLASVLLAAGTGSLQAEEYKNSEYFLALDIPEGWEEVNSRTMKRLNQFMVEAGFGMKCTCVSMFEPSTERPDAFPFVVVVTEFKTSGMTYDQFTSEYLPEFLRKEQKRDRLGGYSKRIAEPTLDPVKQQFTVQFDLSSWTGQKTKMHVVGSLHPDGVFLVIGFDNTKKFQRHVPTFARLGESLRYYRPPPKPTMFDRLRETRLSDEEKMLAVGLTVTALIAVIGIVATRGGGRSRTPRPPFDF